jgi:hypothetical protein
MRDGQLVADPYRDHEIEEEEEKESDYISMKS